MLLTFEDTFKTFQARVTSNYVSFITWLGWEYICPHDIIYMYIMVKSKLKLIEEKSSV